MADEPTNTPTPTETAPATSGVVSEDQVKLALRRVKDPDLQLNIMDLGLVYNIAVDGSTVKIDMTLTSPACPSGPELMTNAEKEVMSLPGVEKVEVNLVWMPFWTPEKMEPRARASVGFWFQDSRKIERVKLRNSAPRIACAVIIAACAPNPRSNKPRPSPARVTVGCLDTLHATDSLLRVVKLSVAAQDTAQRLPRHFEEFFAQEFRGRFKTPAKLPLSVVMGASPCDSVGLRCYGGYLDLAA